MRIVQGWYGSESGDGGMGMMVWGWWDESGGECVGGDGMRISGMGVMRWT